MSAESPYDYGTTPKPAAGRHSLEWGLASMFISGVLVICFPLGLLCVLNGGKLAMDAKYWDEAGIREAERGLNLTMNLAIGAAVIGFLCAIYGGLRAFGGRQPLGACIGGAVLSLMAIGLMIGLTLGINALFRELYRDMPLHRPPAGYFDNSKK